MGDRLTERNISGVLKFCRHNFYKKALHFLYQIMSDAARCEILPADL